MDKFINLFTDFGFKKIFGEEINKELLIHFLNELLSGKEKIKDITYLKNERLGSNARERRAVYDLYCQNEQDEKFIVEVQRVKQEFFKDRSIYYASFALQEQAKKGREWQYELKGVYTIAILDFIFDLKNPEKVAHHVKLLDEQTHQVFYDKLSFIYLEIPKFQKEIHQLQSDYDRWLFLFKNLHKLPDKPPLFQSGIFKEVLDLAEIMNMDKQQQAIYDDSLKDYQDLKAAMDTYKKEGRMEGRKEEKIEVAQNLLSLGSDITFIVKATGLTIQEIEEIKKASDS